MRLPCTRGLLENLRGDLREQRREICELRRRLGQIQSIAKQ